MPEVKPLTAEEIQNLKPGQKLWGYNEVWGEPHSIVGPFKVISHGTRTDNPQGGQVPIIVLESELTGREVHYLEDLTHENNGVFLSLEAGLTYLTQRREQHKNDSNDLLTRESEETETAFQITKRDRKTGEIAEVHKHTFVGDSSVLVDLLQELAQKRTPN